MTFDFLGERLDLDKVAASGQCFRWTPAPLGGYIVPAGGRCATIYKVDGLLRVHEYTIPDHNPGNPDAIAAREWWNYYLDECSDASERWGVLDYYAKREPDDYLSRATRAAEGMRILHQDPFEALVSFIISQNNNIPRIKRTIEGLCRHFGTRHFIPTARGNFPGAEWWDFPGAGGPHRRAGFTRARPRLPRRLRRQRRPRRRNRAPRTRSARPRLL